MLFRVVQNQCARMTLNGNFALCYMTHVSLGAHHKRMNEGIDPQRQRHQCNTGILISGNMKIMQIFEGFAGDGGQRIVRLSNMTSFAFC